MLVLQFSLSLLQLIDSACRVGLLTLSLCIFSIICGLSQFTTKEHIARAALEAVCFQTREVYNWFKYSAVSLLHTSLLSLDKVGGI